MTSPPTLSLEGPPATLLMPLWARAMESVRPDAILRDSAAVAIVESLPFDFESFRRKQVPVADYCIRSRLIDGLVGIEMRNRPHAAVIELGAGLDTRFARLGDGRRWIEVDMPEVVPLRNRFFPPMPPRSVVSARLPDCSWLDAVGDLGPEPPIFVAEGVLYFLGEPDVRRLFTELSARFPGAAFIFDAQSWPYLAFSNLMHPLKARSARLRFAVGRHGAEFTKWDRRFVVERYIGFGDRPEYDAFIRRLSLAKRIAARLHPATRHAFKVLLVRLGERPAEAPRT